MKTEKEIREFLEKEMRVLKLSKERNEIIIIAFQQGSVKSLKWVLEE